jgi:hypothetical protein
MKSGECFDQLSKCRFPKEDLVLIFVLLQVAANSLKFVLHNRFLDHQLPKLLPLFITLLTITSDFF